jgi:uncharacterized iron-regulated membrane protein
MDVSVEARSRRRPLLAPSFVRAMLAGHSALGLAFAAVIYVVCLSGTLAVFVHDFQRWEQPDGPVLAGPASPEAVAVAVHAGYAKALADNAADDLFVLGPVPITPRLTVSYHDHETGAEGSWLADGEGRLVAPVKAPWSEFLLSLHIHLHLRRTWGLFVVGLAGVALLSSLISGLLSHPRIFKDAFALRWGGSKRLQEADLHNRLGVWGLPFHIVVSLTGALLGLSTLIVGVLALAAYEGDSEKAFAALLGPRAGPDETAAPVADIAAMICHVQRERPAAQFTNVQIQHAGQAGQVVHLGMSTPGHLAFSDAYYFDGAGNSLGQGGFELGGVGQRILGLISPLHFGWFGGLAVKLVYGVLGLGLTVVTHSGVTIWLARRRDKGRPAPRWEKVWAATVWGQPLALGTAGAAALTAPEASILPAYLVTAVVALVAPLWMADGQTVARILRLLTAATIVVAVAAHGLVWAGKATDGFAWLVSLAALAAAAVVGLPAVRAANAASSRA